MTNVVKLNGFRAKTKISSTLLHSISINPLKSARLIQNWEFLVNKAFLWVQMGSTTFVECFPFRLFMWFTAVEQAEQQSPGWTWQWSWGFAGKCSTCWRGTETTDSRAAGIHRRILLMYFFKENVKAALTMWNKFTSGRIFSEGNVNWDLF